MPIDDLDHAGALAAGDDALERIREWYFTVRNCDRVVELHGQDSVLLEDVREEREVVAAIRADASAAAIGRLLENRSYALIVRPRGEPGRVLEQLRLVGRWLGGTANFVVVVGDETRVRLQLTESEADDVLAAVRGARDELREATTARKARRQK